MNRIIAPIKMCIFTIYFTNVRHFIYLFLLIFIFSCGKKRKDLATNSQERPKLSVVIEHAAFEDVKPAFEKEIADWQELKTVHSFLQKFQKVSPNEALSNALELRDLVLSLKDSVTPQNFKIPSFEARVNVLYNETLRLADLTLIPAINYEEVNLQVDKTLGAFSSVNSKINTLLSKKRFEDAIKVRIDYDIGIDPTKMDSISKKSIQLNDKKRLLKKGKNKQIILPKLPKFDNKKI